MLQQSRVPHTHSTLKDNVKLAVRQQHPADRLSPPTRFAVQGSKTASYLAYGRVLESDTHLRVSIKAGLSPTMPASELSSGTTLDPAAPTPRCRPARGLSTPVLFCPCTWDMLRWRKPGVLAAKWVLLEATALLGELGTCSGSYFSNSFWVLS